MKRTKLEVGDWVFCKTPGNLITEDLITEVLAVDRWHCAAIVRTAGDPALVPQRALVKLPRGVRIEEFLEALFRVLPAGHTARFASMFLPEAKEVST